MTCEQETSWIETYFHVCYSHLRRWSNSTHISQMGWKHQPTIYVVLVSILNNSQLFETQKKSKTSGGNRCPTWLPNRRPPISQPGRVPRCWSGTEESWGGDRWTPYYTVAINGVKLGYNLPLEMAENIWVTGVVNLLTEVITPCMFAKNREVWLCIAGF